MNGVLLVLILALGAFASSHVKDEVHSQIEILERTKFGKHLIQTIFMQVQTEDPLSNLVNMLQELDADIESAQERDDQRHERQQGNCDSDLGELNDVIGSATTLQLTLKSELEQLNPLKTVSVGSLQRKLGELSDLQHDLSDQADRREREKETYEVIIDEYEQTLYAINQVKNFFNEYLDQLAKNRREIGKGEPSEDSFLAESSSSTESSSSSESSSSESESESDTESEEVEHKPCSFMQIVPKLNKVKHSIKQQGYKMLITVMSKMLQEVKSESDEAELLTRKVLAIVKQIELFIQSQRTFEDQSEQAREELYQQLFNTFTDQIVQSQADKVEMEGTFFSQSQGIVESLGNQISQLSNEKFEVDVKLTNKKQEYEDRETECVQDKAGYDQETEKRRTEREALGIALDLVTSKLGVLKRAIMEKGGY